MPQAFKLKRIAVVFASAAVVAIGWIFLLPLFASPESMIRNAKRVEFVGESYYADGGSVGFNLLAKPRGEFQIILMHRKGGMGGNPAFQEMFVALGKERIVVAPGSGLEKDILGLVSAAVLNTNHWKLVGEPKRERLQWLLERIQNRASPW